MRLAIATASLLLLSANAALSQADVGGTLNPEELTLNRVMKDVIEGRTSMTICATGYYITKSGRHEMARELFMRCAEAGWTGAMTWMSQLDDNGLGSRENPDSAAEWDRRAAEAGDPIGKFNYGLDLMRGRGVVENKTLGRRYIDEAADNGLSTARRLKDAGYDLDVVTPDADNRKYAPAF
ncbi:tetratricopeptide repeat protein [Brucella grignonensis]|uniref:Sel1 repeat family protein n=1 Tax=Brucella grignonensis TaxID=94627 RepID=A0A256FC42_9HYPH|nr:sel1 repeat family protein [Brucella grignonensis]NKB84134.1 sel1 repeat family protein [Brucella grignonensis]OYR12435.1 sel1 repeat family protein [Brucella grignonensis]